ncbi:MAG TPA: N-acyl homoserine lactonase family protein [Allosphingosinicella sp.]|nr:N-acyl homoserine lactonase family protein [Allosphingosinicella sp.]
MLKRALTALLGLTALAGMQPAAAQPAAPAQPAAAAAPEMALWRLDCGEVNFTDFNAFFSDTSEYPSGPKRLVASCYLIRHGDRYLLWDTGLPAGLIGNPNSNPVMTASMRVSIVDQLRQIGVRPEQVAMVGISHYHFDHIGQLAQFPHARLLIGAGDLAALRGTEPGVPREPFARWLTGGGEVTGVGGDHDVFGDGRVVMLNLPGHTPGHHGLLVRLPGRSFLLTGDLYHFTEQVERRGVPPFNTSRAETLASMDRFDRLARNLRATPIIQHEPADIAKLPAFPEPAR